MIFVTVGQINRFDRLVRTVDEWAGETGRPDVFAQIGKGGFTPLHAASAEMLGPEEFREKIHEAELVISHAGMGTILSVMQAGTPMLVMPRLARYSETRNDHQIASARAWKERGGIEVASDETELRKKLGDLGSLIAPTRRISDRASDTLLTSIRSFIDGERPEVIVRRAKRTRRRAA